MLRWIEPIAAVVMLTACTDVLGVEPDIPDHSIPLDPPAIYAEWWTEVERAANLNRGPNRVRWFLVRGGLFFSQRERALSSGRWIPDGRIYLAEGWEMDEANVKHEMLQEILQGDAQHAHPLFEKYDARWCWSAETTWRPCGEVPEGY